MADPPYGWNPIPAVAVDAAAFDPLAGLSLSAAKVAEAIRQRYEAWVAADPLNTASEARAVRVALRATAQVIALPLPQPARAEFLRACGVEE